MYDEDDDQYLENHDLVENFDLIEKLKELGIKGDMAKGEMITDVVIVYKTIGFPEDGQVNGLRLAYADNTDPVVAAGMLDFAQKWNMG